MNEDNINNFISLDTTFCVIQSSIFFVYIVFDYDLSNTANIKFEKRRFGVT